MGVAAHLYYYCEAPVIGEMFWRPVMRVALVWFAARVRTMVAVSAIAAVLLLPSCYRMTDEIAMPDGGIDASQEEDNAEGETEVDAGSGGQAGSAGQAGEGGAAGGAAGTGGIGPMDSGVGPDSGLGDGGPGNRGFPFGN